MELLGKDDEITDNTYCLCDCVFKRCDRHLHNAPENGEYLGQFLFNTEWCPMKIRKGKDA